MKSPVKVIAGLTLLLTLAWGASSWFFAKQANQKVDELIASWPQSSAKYFADIEQLSINKG